MYNSMYIYTYIYVCMYTMCCCEYATACMYVPISPFVGRVVQAAQVRYVQQ